MIKPRPSTQLSFNARTSEALNKIAMKDLQKQLQEEQALEQQDTTTSCIGYCLRYKSFDCGGN